jgi:hypothetical protein
MACSTVRGDVVVAEWCGQLGNAWACAPLHRNRADMRTHYITKVSLLPDIVASFSPAAGWTLANGTSPLPQPDLDIATFQLLRGPHWWIGYGWVGCGVKFDFPDGLKQDYGVPLETCSGALTTTPWNDSMHSTSMLMLRRLWVLDIVLLHHYLPLLPVAAETTPGSGVFTRAWSRATVQVDCNAPAGGAAVDHTLAPAQRIRSLDMFRAQP